MFCEIVDNGIFSSIHCVSNPACQHHMDSNKKDWEKTLSELRKYVMCHFEQILETTAHKTAVVRSRVTVIELDITELFYLMLI